MRTEPPRYKVLQGAGFGLFGLLPAYKVPEHLIIIELFL
jgi:hypothetical protein